MKRNILLGLFFALIINLQSFGTVTFIMKNYSAQVGTQITIPVKVTGFTNIISIQGTIKFDSTKLTLVSTQGFGLVDMSNSSFNLFQTWTPYTGRLTFSWMQSAQTGVTMPDSTTVFTITFNVIGSAGTIAPLTFINSPTAFEVVDNTFNTIGYAFSNGSVHIYTTVSVPEIQSNRFQLYQNQPNPFTDETRFVFSLPEDGLVSFTVYDMLGNKVLAFAKEFQAGNRSLLFNANQIEGSKLSGGTYYYRISCGKYSGTGKMLFIR